jgi:hypothetical protein
MHPAKAREESVLELAAEMHAIIGGICILKVYPRLLGITVFVSKSNSYDIRQIDTPVLVPLLFVECFLDKVHHHCKDC